MTDPDMFGYVEPKKIPNRPNNNLSMNKELRTMVIDDLLNKPISINITDYFDDVEDAKELLEEALSECIIDVDGYRIARELESNGCCPDAQLVEFLDDVSSISYSQYKKLEKQWVNVNEINPMFKVGDTVEFKYGHKTDVGIIVKIVLETAEYHIQNPYLCTNKNGVMTKSIIVKYEDINLKA